MQRYREGGPTIGKVSDGTLMIKQGVIPDYPHNFISVVPCDQYGVIPRTSSGSFDNSGISGSFKVEVATSNCAVAQEIPDQIDAAKPADASWSGNTTAIYVTPQTVVGATHFMVKWSHNIT